MLVKHALQSSLDLKSVTQVLAKEKQIATDRDGQIH